MSEHCPQDGGFIGDAGCTHPNRQHSELVKGIIANAMPRGRWRLISEADAEAAKARFEAACPEAEITMLQGNQPVYHYLISVE